MTFDYPSAISAARSRFDKSYPLRLHDDCLGMLTRHAGNLTSQTGEDGIIAGIFERIGTRSRWCFEVGAADGQRLSNTWALFRDGWQCVLIESDDWQFELLTANRGGRARLFHEKVAGNLDAILESAGAPIDMDLGVIDIDGNELAVWREMRKYSPRVMVVEFNPDGDGVQGGCTEWQAGLTTLEALGKYKGYRLIVSTACNAFFVREDAW